MTITRPIWRAPLRTPLAILVSGGFGYWLGYPLVFLVIALSIVLVYWGYQLHRVELWLDNTESPPPDARGVWGRLFDHIYRLQRQSRETQGRLESSIEYLQDALKSLRDVAIMIDPRGNIVWANDAAAHLLNISIDNDAGRPLVNLIRSPAFADYLATTDHDVPLRLPPTPEQERCFQVEVTTFGGGDRLIFVKDITEQHKLEMMRRDFVGNVSHELRTPLTVLKGYVENLQSLDASIAEKIGRPLAQMDMQVVRMEVLLKDLLWLSRIESIEHSDKTSSVDMGEVISEIIGDLRAAWPDREISLSTSFDGLILGDPMELHSAVSNLVVNALKYSDPNSPVRVEWACEGGRPTLHVIDEGYGIDSVHIPRLTERFYRVDKSRSQKTGGTGLGLAIVKHVAVSHNAELNIDSKVGAGSTFSLVFEPNEAA